MTKSKKWTVPNSGDKRPRNTQSTYSFSLIKMQKRIFHQLDWTSFQFSLGTEKKRYHFFKIEKRILHQLDWTNLNQKRSWFWAGVWATICSLAELEAGWPFCFPFRSIGLLLSFFSPRQKKGWTAGIAVFIHDSSPIQPTESLKRHTQLTTKMNRQKKLTKMNEPSTPSVLKFKVLKS
jgi:hypothetical protein